MLSPLHGDVPTEYLCPITHDIMENPVIASDGYTYEKAAILKWREKGFWLSPVTYEDFANNNLTENTELKALINSCRVKLPESRRQPKTDQNLDELIVKRGFELSAKKEQENKQFLKALEEERKKIQELKLKLEDREHKDHKAEKVEKVDVKPLTRNPDAQEANNLNNRGVELAAEGKLDEAIEAYNSAIKLNPNNLNFYFNLGNALKAQNKLEEAVKAYNSGLEINPEHVNSLINLGIVYKAQGKLQDAVESYYAAIDIAPNDACAYNCLGTALKAQNKLDEAITAYNTAIHLNKKDPGFYVNLGIALRTQGKLEEALKAYHMAVQLDSRYANAVKKFEDSIDCQTRKLAE